MILKKFISDYKKNFLKLLSEQNYDNEIIKAVNLLKECKKKKKKIIIFGNGASASIANHVSVDLTKNSKFRAINFNESNLITCFSNDYGYENWIKEALNFHYDKGDVVILVSSSGNSKNIIKAMKVAKKMNIKIISLTGFNGGQAKKLADINLNVNSKNYGVIEDTHSFIMHSVTQILHNE